MPEIAGTNAYVCDLCGGVFEKMVPEEDAIEEYERLFTEEDRASGRRIVCDPCFITLMAAESD